MPTGTQNAGPDRPSSTGESTAIPKKKTMTRLKNPMSPIRPHDAAALRPALPASTLLPNAVFVS
ncbi:hypothetical protein [Embleya hyalina]|uniref:hypothetical protein n=1 Tax=Embleya hyalina TaxID=516124 RepID=UPI000F81FCF1|nr:hypothetical protein [Embleya hyalina]